VSFFFFFFSLSLPVASRHALSPTATTRRTTTLLPHLLSRHHDHFYTG
jgi:hypothetical protein